LQTLIFTFLVKSCQGPEKSLSLDPDHQSQLLNHHGPVLPKPQPTVGLHITSTTHSGPAYHQHYTQWACISPALFSGPAYHQQHPQWTCLSPALPTVSLHITSTIHSGPVHHQLMLYLVLLMPSPSKPKIQWAKAKAARQ
jgi:hypothetical protein